MTKRKISVTFEARKELINKIDSFANEQETSRASIVRMALQEYVSVRKRPTLPPPRKINIDIEPTFG